MKDLMRRIWIKICDLLSILFLSRFSLIIVLLTIISLEYVGQIKDILVGLNYPESQMQVIYFVLAVNWLAFQSWGWARFIYSRSHPDVEGKRGNNSFQHGLISWLPRIYALSIFVVAYRAAARANIHGVANSIILVGVLVLLFLIYRRKITHFCNPLLKYTPKQSHFLFTLAVVLFSTLLAIIWPVDFGNSLGAGAIVFLGLGCIIPVGTLLVNATRKNGFPVLGALLALAMIFSLTNDNHHVRDISGEKSSTQKYSLLDNFNAWKEQADPDKPMVLVATAGGGLRASYWTGVILGRFQDKIPDFNKQVFAISGVSGGSVGAVFYNGALANKDDCSSIARSSPCFEEKLLSSIGQDYLAPTAAAMLYGDLLQQFLPFPLFADRAAALEMSWERGFIKIYPDSECGLSHSFTDFYSRDQCNRAKRWLPRLLINGTYEESGKRLLTTSFKVDPKIFLDTHDFYSVNNQRAIRASTAALNSARFSYVSPAGTFGDNSGHVIDGGYFENYGATTLANLINWLKMHDQAFSKRGLIVIAISNDSTIPLSQYSLDAVPDNPSSQRFMNEELAPILGLANTRSGHGMLAFKQLDQDVRAKLLGDSTQMVHFYLGSNEGQPPPLGWILSQQAKENMKKQITKEHNCSAYNNILSSFDSRLSGC